MTNTEDNSINSNIVLLWTIVTLNALESIFNFIIDMSYFVHSERSCGNLVDQNWANITIGFFQRFIPYILWIWVAFYSFNARSICKRDYSNFEEYLIECEPSIILSPKQDRIQNIEEEEESFQMNGMIDPINSANTKIQ